jgi:hypothetical protein
LKFPREPKKIAAPASVTSWGEPGAGSAAVRIVPITLSRVRSTIVTLRETKFET